jgi:hypothetical protein
MPGGLEGPSLVCPMHGHFDPLHAMQFRLPPPPQVRDGHPAHGLLGVTVIVRWILLVTAAYGTRVARAARTTILAPGGDRSSLAVVLSRVVAD